METEGSLPCLQKLEMDAIRSLLNPVLTFIVFPENKFSYYLYIILKGLLLKYPTKTLYTLIISPICVTHPAHLSLLLLSQ
jgi:hypothetical protein